jgi:cysteine desulfurase
VEFTAAGADRLVQHSHVRIPGVAAETLLIRLDQEGVAASAGSACHSGAMQASHVLTAMGIGAAAARECIRFTFGWTTEPEDGSDAAGVVARLAEALR